MTDPYATLGVTRTSSDDEIRRAYRKLARRWHPDVNPNDKQSEEKFKEISAAYEIVSNPERRKLYDEFGHEGLAGGFDPEKAREYRRWAERRQASGGGTEIPYEFDLEDLFAQRAARPSGPRAGRDLEAVVELDFVDALRGTEVEFRIPARKTCPTCHGSGDKPGTTRQTCKECNGTGRKQVVQGPLRMMTTCPVCDGSGKVGTPCPTCNGDGSIETDDKLKVRIPPGADDGSELRVRGRGAPGRDGGPAGDLIVRTRVRPHPVFSRHGLDLSLKLPVTVDEAYNGASVEVPTPDGPVTLKVPARSQTGTRLRLRGKGVARDGSRGDLYAELDVRVPDKEDEQLAAALRDSARLYSRPVRDGVRL